MPIQTQLENGSLIGGGGAAFKGANVHLKPLDHGTLGHYRTSVKIALTAAQAANARLFELRNTGANLVIPTMLAVTVLPIGNVASPYVLDLSLFKSTGFTVVDTTNALTPGVSVARFGMAAAPGSAQVRHANGHQAGMTGGTLTKDSNPIATLVAWMASVSATSLPVMRDLLSGARHAMHPMSFAQNEGLVLENVLLGSATVNQVQVVIEIAWAEVTAY